MRARLVSTALCLCLAAACPPDTTALDGGATTRADSAGGLDRTGTDLTPTADRRIDDSTQAEGGGDVTAADKAATDIATTDTATIDTATTDTATTDTATTDTATADVETADVACPRCEDSFATCTDGDDNDGDTYTDCRDFDCGAVWPCNVPEDSLEACTDGYDNDGDTYTDCRDFDCGAVWPCDISEDSFEACADGFDNDGDTYIDCRDFGCLGFAVCDPNEDHAATCSDTVDNDGDHAVDCDDPGCAALPLCQPDERDAATCQDGVDNDGDGDRDCRDPECANLPVCQLTSLRVATWNVAELGAPDSPAFEATAQIVARLDADLICLQEVKPDEGIALAALAARTGYPHVFQGQVSTWMAGELTNACLSRRPIVEARSLSSGDISSDPAAREMGRDFVALRLEVGGAHLGVLVTHLKSGFTHADFFRRAVEALRLGQAAAQLQAAHPAEGLVVMGDFNEEIDGADLGRVYEALPDGMPASFVLGTDLSLPVVYDPFASLLERGLTAAAPSLEDAPGELGTRVASGRRIDYQLHAALVVLEGVVYDDCRDNGVDDPPVGDWIELAGEPLPCGALEATSDHRPVVVSYRVD